MARSEWVRSNRRASLPSNWRSIRAAILQRDPTCRLRYDGCTFTSTEVDHIGDPQDHQPHNLRGVCHPCHTQRTRQQARAARKPPPSTRRPSERHPGLL